MAVGIVTPEAVRLDFQPASIGTRSLAILLDLLIQGTVLIGVSIGAALAVGAGIGPGLPEWVGITLLLLTVFALLWGYPTVSETIWGRTLGKAALGLRVVTREGAPVSFRHAAVRASLALIDLYGTVGGGAILTVLLSKREQRLGDLVAGTLVVRERSARGVPRPVRFDVPPGLESYAATLDPAVLDAASYQAVRTFLIRAAQMPGDARAAVARRLADPLVERLRTTPPAQVGPEVFLLCLAARYQRR